jgi:sugar phosphate isomerase/epimerase
MIFWWRENNLSFEQECQYLKSQGFGIELQSTIKGHVECRYSRGNWARLAAATEGMLVSMRSRRGTNGGINLDKWQEQLECAKMLKANIITDLRSLGMPPGENTNGSTLADEVIKLAEDLDVMICVETGSLDNVLKAGERFESLRYCLDTGFAHLDANYNFQQYVDKLIDRTTHLHLSDNYGRIDDHEPPGLKGGMPVENWHYLLEKLQENNSDVIASLEMSPSMPAVMLRQATQFLFGQMSWPDQPEKAAEQTFTSYNPV